LFDQNIVYTRKYSFLGERPIIYVCDLGESPIEAV